MPRNKLVNLIPIGDQDKKTPQEIREEESVLRLRRNEYNWYQPEGRDWANATLEQLGRWHDEDVPLEPWYVDYCSEEDEEDVDQDPWYADYYPEEYAEEDLREPDERNVRTKIDEYIANLPKVDKGSIYDIIVE